MNKKFTIAIAASIALTMFFACTPKNVKLQTPVQDESIGKGGFADSTGRVVVSYIYEEAGPFTDGLAKVNLNGKSGFIDYTGEAVIPLMYESLGDFYDGLAKAGLDGKYGYIDNIGQEVIPLIYDAAADFSDGKARVQQDGKYYFINQDGGILPDEMYFEQLYRQTAQNIPQLVGFMIKDVTTGEELTFKKLIVNNETVQNVKWNGVYTASAEEGLVVKIATKFLLNGGKSVEIEIPEQYTRTFKYQLENETLTILDEL